MIWVLVLLGGMVAVATALAPSFIKTQAREKAEDEDQKVQEIASAIERSVLRTQIIPGVATWDAAAADDLGRDLITVRQVFPQFPASVNTRRVFAIDPAFQPASGAPILPYNQAPTALDPLLGQAPNLNTRIIVASSSVRTLPLPFVSGSIPSPLFNNLWDWMQDGTGNSPLAAVSPAWVGRGSALHVGKVDLRSVFSLVSFRKLAYALPGNPRNNVPATLQRYFIKGTVINLFPLTNSMLVARHVVGGDASFDLGSIYEPIGWWRFDGGVGLAATNFGKLAPVGNAASTNGCGTLVSGPRAPPQIGYLTNNVGVLFDGVDDYLDTQQSLMNNFTQFTLACWVKPASSALTTLAFCGQSGVVQLGLGAGNNLKFVTSRAGSTSVLYPHPTNQWHHVAITGDGSALKIFLDGSLVKTGGGPPAGGSYGASSSTFRIGGGAIFDATGNYFQGQIDEVLVFDKALSVAQLQGLVLNQVPQ